MKENINLNKLSEKIVVAPFALGKTQNGKPTHFKIWTWQQFDSQK